MNLSCLTLPAEYLTSFSQPRYLASIEKIRKDYAFRAAQRPGLYTHFQGDTDFIQLEGYSRVICISSRRASQRVINQQQLLNWLHQGCLHMLCKQPQASCVPCCLPTLQHDIHYLKPVAACSHVMVLDCSHWNHDTHARVT